MFVVVQSRLQVSRRKLYFDCVGLPGSLQLVIDYATYDVKIIVVGLCMVADTIFPAKAITKELDLRFAFVYSKADFEFIIDLLSDQRIDPSALVSGCVGFDTFAETFESLKQPEDQIKVMLDPWS